MPGKFVSPDWVVANHSEVTVVEARREGEDEDDHIPDAVPIPFERFRDPSDEMVGKLPTATAFASLLGEAGITSNDRLVAYDDDHGVYASRFVVTAEIFGHDPARLHLLDGDIKTWAQTFETTASVSEIKETDYTCRRQPDAPLVSAAELEEALTGEAVIVDTRDPLEYNTVHLPGAVNFQWRNLVSGETRQLKSRQEIKQILQSHSIIPGRPIRLYCNTARRLSFVYVVLKELGYDDVAFYEGGIDTWAAYGGPVETSPPT